MTSNPPAAERWEVARCRPQPVHQEQGWVPQWGLRSTPVAMRVMGGPTQSPSLSSYHRFKSDRSSPSTSSSVASMSEGSGGSGHPCHGQWPHMEPRGCIKINLPVFKDEDMKDAITYQSWCWALTVYLLHWVPILHPSSPMPFIAYKVTWGIWLGAWDRHHLG